jgi:ketosteroid isomerase-like protein
MKFTRRHLTAAVVVLSSGLLHSPSLAQSGDEAAVNQAVEELKQAMLKADKAKLEDLLSDKLSYGHSGGVIENKAQFIDVIAGKKTIYKTITVTEPSTSVVGDNAIVRHKLVVEFETDGKPGTSSIGALQVWNKEGGRWKLLARQAFRLAA